MINNIESGGIQLGCEGMSALDRKFWVDKDNMSSKQAYLTYQV